MLEALLERNVAVSTGNFVFRRTLAAAIGGFAALAICHDWDFILEATRHARVVRVAEPLYRYRLHGGNTVSARVLAGLVESEGVLARFLARIRSHPRLDAATLARIRIELADLGRSELLPG